MTKIKKAYGLNNPEVFPVPIKAKRSPKSNDKKDYVIGQMWIDELTADVYVLSRISGNSATWSLLSPLDTEGGKNITTKVSSSKLTIEMDDDVTIGRSIISPIFITSTRTARLIMTGYSIHADGTKRNIPINLVPKGTEEVKISGTGLNLTSTESQLKIKGGTEKDSIGKTTLLKGKRTVSYTNIDVNDIIILSRSTARTSTKLGVLESSIIPTVGFEIRSLETQTTNLETEDLSEIYYLIVRQL